MNGVINVKNNVYVNVVFGILIHIKYNIHRKITCYKNPQKLREHIYIVCKYVKSMDCVQIYDIN